ncbi:MAG: enolase C-terminal domain-like protein [Acidimicrobiia bacterium]
MTDVRLYLVVIRLAHPVRGTTERPGVLVEGPLGWGEWSPVPGFPCDPQRAWDAAYEAATASWPTAQTDVIDVAALVGDDSAIDALDPQTSCVKVKVGDDGDIDRVAQVRDRIGPHARLRVDANGVWDIETACARLRAMARYDLEFAEQPVATLEDLAIVRRQVSMPIAADECVRSIDDVVRLRSHDAADILVAKVQACGGVRALLDWAEQAARPVVVSSMLETSVGLAAGVAAAAALGAQPFAHGLGTGTLVLDDVVDVPLRAHNGQVRVARPDVVLARVHAIATPTWPESFPIVQERA